MTVTELFLADNMSASGWNTGYRYPRNAVIPYVEPRTIQENESIDGSELPYFEQRAAVDERTGSIVGKDDLHQGSEALDHLVDARIAGRLRHVKPVDKRRCWASCLPSNKTECLFA